MAGVLLSIICVALISQSVYSEEKVKVSQRHKRSLPSPDESPSCANDYMAMSVCLACIDLPPATELSLEACCSSSEIQMLCAACLMDIDGCTKEMSSYDSESAKEFDKEESSEKTDLPLAKRFGRLFMGTRLPRRYLPTDHKRYGSLFLSNSPYTRVARSNPGNEEKRFGTLFMGSSPGLRIGRNYDYDREKRYGTLFMNKRFGRLFLGSGPGRILFNRRS